MLSLLFATFALWQKFLDTLSVKYLIEDGKLDQEKTKTDA